MSISSINKHIDTFSAIGLDEIDNLSFQKRLDTKYVFNVEKLELFLGFLDKKHKVLQIKNIRIQEYETIYYDTPELKMYCMHHNRVRSRFKVRSRKYINSNSFFLEVKQKNNKGITSKKRLAIDALRLRNDELRHAEFVAQKTPFKLEGLIPVIKNRFKRLTLVREDIPMRITIDWDLRFTQAGSDNEKSMNNICIVEVKKENGTKNPEFDNAIKSCKIYPMGFSKYCFGVLLLNSTVKQNYFKPRLQSLQKLKLI
ncbi:MAG: polyphosphate polymerase domain-containing protein [Bacteroidota bacterium]|nr:polyphosphate polymerase domain-containing protein [Bacteroidota bacterium]